jgi:glycine cleavage system aminomethyltransferase T
VGKEALRRIADEGVDRKLVGVEIAGAPMTDEGALNEFWAVRDGERRTVGRVTAGAWSPRLERNVGYAWVPIGLADVGTELRLDAPGDRTATVAPLPFVDPHKEIPKA